MFDCPYMSRIDIVNAALERGLRREEKWLQHGKGILPGSLSYKARQILKDEGWRGL